MKIEPDWKMEIYFPFTWLPSVCSMNAQALLQTCELLTKAKKNEDSIRESEVFSCYFYSYFFLSKYSYSSISMNFHSYFLHKWESGQLSSHI